MDPVDEKASMLSRAGSFYYNTVSATDRTTVQRLSHFSCNCRAFRQLSNSSNLVLSGGYFEDNWKVIRFKDDQILYYGAEEALQKRYVTITKNEVGASRPANMFIEDSFLPVTEENKGLAEFHKPLIFPGGDEDLIFPQSFQLLFGLLVDKDLYITTIELDDGTILRQNMDFQSQFGLINFYENPIKLFSGMKFMARSYVYRRRNLYSFTLGIDDVYGPVDRIMAYYRKVQSPKALYYAAAQAAGMPVVRRDCEILGVMPLHSGCSYMTNDGRYDAAFPHNHLSLGTKLTAGTVIGGADLFEMYGPNDPLPNNLDSINLDMAIPVKGLSAQNAEVQLYLGDAFRPQYAGDTEALQKYWDYIHTWNNDTPGTDVVTGNAMVHFLTTVAANRYILLRINEDGMTKKMRLKLLTFLDRERPLGSVLLFAPLRTKIVEE